MVLNLQDSVNQLYVNTLDFSSNKCVNGSTRIDSRSLHEQKYYRKHRIKLGACDGHHCVFLPHVKCSASNKKKKKAVCIFKCNFQKCISWI